MPGEGTYFCVLCGWQVALRETDELPSCDSCGSAHFRRDSIFSPLQEHGSPTLEFAVTSERATPGWLDEARGLTQPGYNLAMREGGEIVTFHLGVGWSRIGRCETAEIYLDDPSVSRRHAVIATDGDRPPRILDDRSLNGLRVNGRKTDFAELRDGDEISIGRHRLYLLHA
ncbi:MAG TPA: FHA domain-containing protein [Solirubrobacterales bacterium]|nr:FHA domain-containing protein [Solirubrobacterales bacterium]